MRIAEKEKVVAVLSERLGKAKGLYLTDFTGLDVASMTELRRRLAEAHVEYIVVKNTLARRALAGSAYEAIAEDLAGANAIALSGDDVVAAAKILTDFARDRDKPKIKAGVIEGQVVSMVDIRRIAELPPREVLLAQLIGSARAPLAGLVYTLNGLLAKFVRTIDALRMSKDAEQTAEAEPAPQVTESSPEPEAEA
jgi:large subunit ribosomal protein L10